MHRIIEEFLARKYVSTYAPLWRSADRTLHLSKEESCNVHPKQRKGNDLLLPGSFIIKEAEGTQWHR